MAGRCEMAITDEQFDEWAKRPDSVLPGLTIDILTEALKGAERLRRLPFEIYVQGSYANETNISSNSDVDLVIQMKMPFEENIAALDQAATRRFREHYQDTDYGWEEFRWDVEAALRRSFFVDPGNRCVKVKDWDSVRVPADILPAIEYRLYRAFPSLLGEKYDEGVFFRDKELTPIINYPKLHLKYGNEKNRETAGRFKQIVRVVKHARLQKDFGPEAARAPSYFIECLLFNVPNQEYEADRVRSAYEKVITWLANNTGDIERWKCQNGIVQIFGDHPEAWSVQAAQKFIFALRQQRET
jgi:hypothetical protein